MFHQVAALRLVRRKYLQKKFATSAVVNNVKMSEPPAYGLA